MRLILVRHGETVWNRERRIQGGGSDVELSDCGRKQAESLGLLFKGTDISAIYSSPLTRAMDTAEAIIAGHQGLTVQVVPDLREMEVGELEGVPVTELGASFGEFLARWRQGEGLEKLPGGESMAEMGNRVWSAFGQISAKHSRETVLLVSHFFVTVTIVCKALGLPLNHMERVRVQTGSVSVLDFNDERPRLVRLGDTCHLREG